MITHACECGAAIHLCSNADGIIDFDVMHVFIQAHDGHEQVSAGEARDIRAKAKRERASA